MAGSLEALGSARPGQGYLSPIASVLGERGPASAPERRAYSRPTPPHREARSGPRARDPHGAGGRRPGRAQPQPRGAAAPAELEMREEAAAAGAGPVPAAAARSRPAGPLEEPPAGTRSPAWTVSSVGAPPRLQAPPRAARARLRAGARDDLKHLIVYAEHTLREDVYFPWWSSTVPGNAEVDIPRAYVSFASKDFLISGSVCK